MIFNDFFKENVRKALLRLKVPFVGNCCEGAKQVVQLNPDTDQLETVAPDGTITTLGEIQDPSIALEDLQDQIDALEARIAALETP